MKRGSTTISLAPLCGLGLRHPFEAARMRFGGIAAHDDDEIRVLDVGPGVGHRATAKRRGQTGHRRAVSDTRLVVEYHHAECCGRPCRSASRFRWWSRRRPRKPVVVQRLTVTPSRVVRDEVRVAVVLHQLGDAVERVVPGDALELVGAGLAVHRILERASATCTKSSSAGALRAQRAAVDGVVGVALDVDDRRPSRPSSRRPGST